MLGIGKLLIICGILLLIAGLFMLFFEKVPLIGKLPGDIYIKRGNFSFYFPITTGIIISIIISILLKLFK